MSRLGPLAEARQTVGTSWNYSSTVPCTDCTNIKIIANTRASPILGVVVLELLVLEVLATMSVASTNIPCRLHNVTNQSIKFTYIAYNSIN